MDYKEMLAESKTLALKAKGILENPNATAEEKANVAQIIKDAQKLAEESAQLKQVLDLGAVEAEAQEQKTEQRREPQAKGFKNLGHFLYEAAMAGNVRAMSGGYKAHAGLKRWYDADEPAGERKDAGWQEKATMVENVGARGGFLVPPEFRNELMGVGGEAAVVRNRATIIPMARRQITLPAVDQTGTTAGQPHVFGGLTANWTEEQGLKTQSEPTFRQLTLTAHKLVLYSRSSDELLDDEAIGLAAFLTGPMGFTGAIQWFEEYAFLRGTGVGQPLGVLNAGATVSVARAADSGYSLADFANMYQAFMATGGRGVWMLTQNAMANIIQMAGPSGNASYIWQPSARDGVPDRILGLPVIWTEKLPTSGQAGDILLANWPYYLVGDRQRTTIESTNVERFQYDETSWRCVHRVDGQPWLSAPLTLADGVSQISPFVILGNKSS